MPGQAADRIEGLYAWRAILMLGGLLLHATMGREDYPPFVAINIASGSFRMGTFFMIAGLLSGFALVRRPSPHAWLRRRLLQLGIPTVFSLLVISPVIGALTTIRSAAPMPPFSMYHLWFMVTLIAYSLLAYVVHRADRHWPVFRHVEQRSPVARVRQSIVLLGTGTASFVLTIVTLRMLAGLTGPVASLTRQVPLMVGYAPVFLLGLAAARIPTLRRILIARVRMPMLVLIGTVVAHLLWRSVLRLEVGTLLTGSIDNLLLAASGAWCPPAAAALILRSASAIRHVPPLLRRLSDASLTMYILHYPIIVALKVMVLPWHWHPLVEWAASVIVGGTLSYIAHVHIVDRSRFMALLLNGRLPPRPQADIGLPATARV